MTSNLPLQSLPENLSEDVLRSVDHLGRTIATLVVEKGTLIEQAVEVEVERAVKRVASGRGRAAKKAAAPAKPDGENPPAGDGDTPPAGDGDNPPAGGDDNPPAGGDGDAAPTGDGDEQKPAAGE